MALTREEKYARTRARKQTDESKEKRREYDKKRLSDPVIRERMKAYRQSDRGKDVTRRASKKHRAKPEYKEYKKNYRNLQKTKDKRRDWDLQRKFGISLVQYNEMLFNQSGVCAICFNPETFVMRGTTHSLAVDHCHKTGKVRGLLCRSCNQAIGMLEDNITRISSAIAYLKK